MNSPDLSRPPLFRRDLAPPDFGLIDVHANLGATDAAGIGYGRLSPEEYRRLMTVSGVRAACVFPPLMDDYRPANESLRRWARTTDAQILPFARLGGARGPRPVRAGWQARRVLRRTLVRDRPTVTPDLAGYAGVKLIPHLSGLPDRATLAQIDSLRLPVLVHGGVHSPPAWIERALVRRLRGPLIIAHLGAYPADDGLVREAVALAGRVDRVYLDTSGQWISEFLRFAARSVPDKLLFGSDAPLTHPLTAWFQLQSTIADDKLLERIGRTNAAELLGISQTP